MNIKNMNMKKMLPSVSFGSPLSALAAKAPGGKLAAVLWGLALSFGMILGCTLIYSLVNFFTELLKPEYAAPAAMLISICALFSGGFLTARKSGSQGLIMGIVFACCFYLVITIIGSVMGYPISSILGKCYYGLAAAAVGGICGVK
ncbi:MAG: TIGR04086 family membrane protein [Peptococcaceae bacterium]|nr:TIGR04086 family membrane protein [Peptococcaceae bacterium]